ncbi:hypothetical protein FJV41_08105 [Myxococcus llanfairpwllgwyngyllgogerychwyrndrobwllllantysiliogogogochensis]|uniref:VCBS repeat-containing protein n=1 Tax=Myxococcus llanfairpwllgwyngyllgogerychwyrndrobwllllantysiliogogogochensis TaxID=2590453 RepID=A0A540X5A7_9BACT|nr:hypothetical protein [Myxococcus llanfairpwllgwyngyllgogerychwyrndrobwllllantysiliogogogochensis]TQF16437.1 hypothetical protein FJV41_08105 [Myxococcus llanfairpwllgwyngyllgogerychwyrndrobwllllantysiliogogogochensis]
MKTQLPALAVTTFALLGAPLAQAGDELPTQSASADLNGDGKPEAIAVKWKEGDEEFVLTAGTATLRGKTDSEVLGLSIIDVDSGDKRKEVAVHTGMTDNDRLTTVYAFDGKSLKALGSVHALTEVKGNGIILSDSWEQFWNRRDKFALDAKAGKLSLVPQELYYVGQEATVREGFPITHSRTDKKPVATLAAASKILVLAAAPVPVQGGRSTSFVYLVKSSTGLLGWVSHDTLLAKTEGLTVAG